MNTARMEAFSDGVIAIIITIMVLELKVPHTPDLPTLAGLLPVFLSYILSFIYVGIYWTNHHHMLQTTQRVTGSILWSNLHLLFWLSLIPFVTGWMGENHFAVVPTALYGAILLMCAVAYLILQSRIIHSQGANSILGRAVGHDSKGKISFFCYAAAVVCAVISPWISQALYVAVAILWLIPDKRIEREMK